MSVYMLFLLLGLGAGSVYALLGAGTGAEVPQHWRGRLRPGRGRHVRCLCLSRPAQQRPAGAALDRAAAPAASLRLRIGGGPGAGDHVGLRRRLRSGSSSSWSTARSCRRRRSQRYARPSASCSRSTAVAVLNFGTTSQATAPILPSRPVSMGGIVFPSDRLYLAGIVVVMALALALVFQRTTLRPSDPCQRGERDRRGPDRHLGSSVAGSQLGDRQRAGHLVRHPDHPDLGAGRRRHTPSSSCPRSAPR